MSATVETVIPQNKYVLSVLAKDSEQVSVTFFFEPKKWASQLQGIMPGDPVRVAGQVDIVRGYHVVFTSCELIGGTPRRDAFPRPWSTRALACRLVVWRRPENGVHRFGSLGDDGPDLMAVNPLGYCGPATVAD